MKAYKNFLPTRSAARSEVKSVKASGKDCKLVDHGKEAAQRWEVVTIGRETLTIDRKAPTPCNHIGKRSTASKAVKWLSRTPVGTVEIHTKRSVGISL